MYHCRSPRRSHSPGSCAFVSAQREIGGIWYHLWRATWRHPYFKRLNKDIPSVIKAENGDISHQTSCQRWRHADNYRAISGCNRWALRCPFGSFHISVFWFVPVAEDIMGGISHWYQKCLMHYSLDWTKRLFSHILSYKAMNPWFSVYMGGNNKKGNVNNSTRISHEHKLCVWTYTSNPCWLLNCWDFKSNIWNI